MPTGFATIPDWFSFENQGANITVADIDGDGRLDLLVLMVDHPTPGPNRGVYRLGRKLDATGTVTGGWGPWMEVPDWFSFENQGAGIAVADLDGDGSLDLVIFMIDNPPGLNRGVYRIGRNLDSNGVVTGGWTPWLDVPNWFSWENQGSAVALGKADTNGRRDMIVFIIDNPPGANRGIYQIGRGLDSNGVVSGGWTGWLDVPDWFSWENQGAGIALIDKPSGQRDVVVFQIDNPPGQNQAFFRLGSNLGPDGRIAGNWSPWFGVPGWFSWENQGGSIAAADLELDGNHQLIALLVDSPGGQNAGLIEAFSLEDDPKVRGSWELLPYLSEVLPVHAALLHTGEVLFAAGSGNSAVRFNDASFGDIKKGFFCSVVWDPAGSTSANPKFFHPETLRNAEQKVLDFFCGGETFLADGRLIAVGGTEAYDVDPRGRDLGGFKGRDDVLVFDPTSRGWSPLAHMGDGRWYPTPITLADGRILVGAGFNKVGDPNRSLEVFTPDSGSGKWEQLPLPSAAVFSQLPLYSHLFLMKGGLVFFSGGRMDDGDISLAPCLIDITRNPIAVTALAGLEQADSRNQSASILLPPAQDQRVMILGGAPPTGEGNATDSVDVIDLATMHPMPTFRPAANLLLPRVHANAVILPDRTVFVSGGALQREGGVTHRTTARFQSEIFDTLTGEWKLGATAQIARMYHSVALLLPDGRVVAAGGNPEKGQQTPWLPPDPNEELHLEVYSPPYLSRGPQPTITAALIDWTYGSTVDIGSPQASTIRWASLIRSSATTHSFNTSQRLIDLPIQARSTGKLTVAVTADRHIAPPGWYMLFLTDNDRVPSIARWVKLS